MDKKLMVGFILTMSAAFSAVFGLALLGLGSISLAVLLDDTYVLPFFIGAAEISLFYIVIMERRFNLFQTITIPVAISFLIAVYFINFKRFNDMMFLDICAYSFLLSSLIIIICVIRGSFYTLIKIEDPRILERREREAKLKYQSKYQVQTNS